MLNSGVIIFKILLKIWFDLIILFIYRYLPVWKIFFKAIQDSDRLFEYSKLIKSEKLAKFNICNRTFFS